LVFIPGKRNYFLEESGMKQKGLSLMEIMIALVIVAILAGLGYPRYQKMVSRSKQTEAKTILRALYMGQDLYLTSHQIYAADLNSLDVGLPENSRYIYSITIDDNGTTFEAKATANIDGDPAIDEWTIDHKNRLVNTVNDVIE